MAAQSQLQQPQAPQVSQQPPVAKQMPTTTPQLPAQKLTATSQLNSTSAAVSLLLLPLWSVEKNS